MPKVIKLYQKSRSSLKHNMGGWFEKKKPEKEPIKTVTTDTLTAIEKKKKALQDALKATE